MFNSKDRLLLTGGTGSFGKAFLHEVLNRWPHVGQICIYSRDELKQWELQQTYPKDKFPQLRFFLGDIRDIERLKVALEGVNIVIHAAALKHVPAAEYNPIEFVKTNVLGAENLVQACLVSNVKKLIALSTDKASAPINLYGATKLCSDKLFIAANNIVGSRDLSFSIVRYGNVMGSRGSVIPLFLKMAKDGKLTITDERMTRFNITLSQGVNMVLWALDNSNGGEIFVPKIPSYNINDLAEAIAPSCKKEIIGIRGGEKIHEEMITSSDSHSTIDIGEYYVILPAEPSFREEYIKKNIQFSNVPQNFSYNSKDNVNFLSVDQIRKLIMENIDSNFNPI